ncbi:transglycosylase SLT domain-containing protein [Bacillus vallismortis]|uniref:transglycosylase SLT domain-containing protein n=1 Tax=Bacillus vallismortis TaxID=72361 RepID=UPI00352FF2CF
MAKLTARFDLEDKVSKKLKRIHKGFQMVEKKVKTINRQIKISIKAEDQAFYRLRKINDYIVLKFAKSLEVKVVLDDQATAGLDVIEQKLKRLPKERNITVSLIDHATDAYKKLKKMLSGNQFSVDLFVNDQVTPATKRILGYLQKNLKKGYSVKLKVIDEITKTVNRITALLRDFEKTYTVNITAKEKLAADKINEKKPEEKKNWFMQLLEDFGTAFKDKVIDKILDWLFEKIPGFKKNDNETNTPNHAPGNTQSNDKVDKRNTGRRCCCCCCGGGGNRSRSKANKRYKKRKSPTSARTSGRTLRVPGEVLRRRQGGASGENATSGRNSGSKFRNWFGSMRSVATDSSKWGKVLTPLKGLGKFAKRVPVLGAALQATDLLGMNKDNAGEKVGKFTGGLAGMTAGAEVGATAGAAIGSFIPGIGTVVGGGIGGVIGGAAGAFGGEKAGGSLGKMFDVSQMKEDITNTLFNGDWWSEKWTGVKTSAGNTLGGLDETWNNIKTTASTTFFDSNWWAEKAGYAYGALESTLFNSDWWGEKWGSVKDWTQEKWDEASSVWNSVKSKVKDTVFNKDWWSGKWEGVKGWAQEKWDGAVSVWESIKSKVKDTVFNKDWWSGKWEGVKGWTKEKWENTKSLFKKFKSTLEDSLFNKDWWSKKWGSVKEWGKNILGDSWNAIKSAGGKAVETAKKVGSGVTSRVKEITESFQKGKEKAHKDFGYKADKNATGGYITKPTISWIGEAGKEFVIPVDNNRGRGKMLLSQAASKLGMQVVDDMGAASSSGGSSVSVSGGAAASPVSGSASPSMNTANLTGQASALGQQFSEGIGKGISKEPVNMEDWKKKNINTPFTQMISASPNYGKQMVSGYTKGQNGTATGTDGFLQTKVKTPFQNTVNKSSSWGTGTIKGFASGQNSSQTGTDQYVNTHVNKPFVRSKESSNGWGSGMIGNFVSGMTSKASDVHEAAKELAKKVEKAFREELDIHSPSRVMMSLGRFASVGVVKGLDSVDVKKYAEKQAGSLAAAYSGMGAAGGNVKQWLMAAMMATKTPLSWLSGLMTIAQYESGGNPNSINLWDSNAKAGNPSQGLMQTVPTTFNAHKAPGMGNIRNPIHNAAAAIGYIKSRYGSIDNVPGIKSLKRGGPYVGYANGGLITKEQIARVGEGNKREWIIPEERGIRGRYLLQKAAQALGMEVTDPSQSQQPELSSGQVSAVTSGTRQTIQTAGTKEIKIEFNGDQHFHNGQDADSLVAKMKQALLDELQKDINTGTKGVVAFD